MKYPHPSGRPIRNNIKPKCGSNWWRIPLDQPATPRLREKYKPMADAIGYQRIDAISEEQHAPGFIDWNKKQ